MSVLDTQTKVNSIQSFYAPAGSSGGGGGTTGPTGPTGPTGSGGGGSNFNDITVSSITFSGTGQPLGYDIGFPPGYIAEVQCDTFQVQPTVGSGLIVLDCIGQVTNTSNVGIYIQGNGGASLEITCAAESAITLDGGDYLSIDTCIPSIYRAQFIDAASLAAPNQPTIAIIEARAGPGMYIYDGNGNEGQLLLSSIIVSSINATAFSENLSLNTITFSGASTPSLLMENTAILFNDLGSAASIGAAQMGWNSAASNLNVIAPSTSSVFIGTDKLVGGLSVNDDGVFARLFLSTPNLQVSSINGAAPGAALSNFNVPFINGAVSGNTYNIVVDSNTGGLPLSLTSTLVVNSSHSYLVSYTLDSGSNSDTASYSQIELVTSLPGGPSPILQTAPGFSNFWIFNGSVGARATIISGTSLLRLQGRNTSASQQTTLYLDNNVGFRVTDLGPSS